MKYRLLGSLAALLMAGATFTAAESGQAVAAPASCDASDTAIYTPPAAVSAAPGTLLACEAVTLPKVPGNIPMKAWKVRYASTDVRGTPIAVAVPAAAWTRGGSRPVIGFNPGTLGLGPQCAFSKQLAGAYQDEYEGDQIAAILKAGYAVAATDGVGYLNGLTHTYVVGRNAGHALLDAVRTAFQVPGGGLGPDAKVGVWGYSEGGQASLWAAQLASSYAPELHVVGDAAGGVPGDLKITAAGLNGGPFAGFLLAAVLGLHTAYPSMPFDSLLNDTGRSAIQQGKSLCLVGTVTAFAFADIGNYTKDGLTLDQIYALSGPDGTTWSDLIDAQRLGVGVGPAWSGAQYRIGFPVLQYRGLADEVIPAATEDGTHRAYCSAGVTTQWNTYAGDHLTADNQAINDVMGFFADRIAGRFTLGNC
ncbi:lipase family protein [Actinoallomurus soli]|uniref:lipase family protein n=1 Tax=Actinoallomurus soli TaxID=2952535 RepID=UPI002092733B|nr:lipase family protein [Actinoallomurus soli]MCO5969947.1 lipase family protein [Actinoallomurus soli]